MSKDNCGKYWICTTLPVVYKPVKVANHPEPIGIDVGIKDIAILSNGIKYENRRYKNGIHGEVQIHRRLLDRRLSRRWGWANIKFRDAHKADKTIVPSKSYFRTQQKISRFEQRIMNQRNWANNNITSDIVRQASMIGIESLSIKNMFRNRHLANALSDASMSTILQQIKYKSDWYGVPCHEIARWTPSSKQCSVCGYIKKDLTLSIRTWICPICKTHHDRDVNAAKNILKYAM